MAICAPGRCRRRRPANWITLGLTVKKVASDYLIVPYLFSPDGSRDQLYLSNYATLHIKDAIARLDGVGDVQTFGARDYAMRIWLDPAKVAADDLTAGEVVAALRAQNVQVSAGVLAQPPVGSSGAFATAAMTEQGVAHGGGLAAFLFRAGGAMLPTQWRVHQEEGRMGDLIHDRRQKPLPWQSHKTVCRRCKDSKTVYYAAMSSGVEVIGGRRVRCPECSGKGIILEPDHPSCSDAVGNIVGLDRQHARGWSGADTRSAQFGRQLSDKAA